MGRGMPPPPPKKKNKTFIMELLIKDVPIQTYESTEDFVRYIFPVIKVFGGIFNFKITRTRNRHSYVIIEDCVCFIDLL